MDVRLRAELSILAGLCLLAGTVQGWMIARSVVPAQDAVRYVAQAQQIQQQGLGPFLRANSVSPGFPWWVAQVDAALQRVLPDRPARWARAVQWGAAWAAIAAVVPVYLAARAWFGTCVACGAAAVWSCLPEVARLGADGLADSLQLLALAMAWWCWSRAVTAQREPALFAWLAGSGLAIGTGVFVRAEGLVWLAAGFLAMALLPVAEVRRWLGWRVRAAGAGALLAGFAAVWLPYLGYTSSWTGPQIAGRLLGQDNGAGAQSTVGSLGTIGAPGALLIGEFQPPIASPQPDSAAAADLHFALKEAGQSSRFRGAGAASRALGVELLRATALIWPFLAALGGAIAGFRGQLRRARWLSATLVVLYLAAAGAVAAQHGYLVARHLVPISIPLIGWGVYALLEFRWPFSGELLGRILRAKPSWRAAAVCVASVLGCLIALGRPAHASHEGHRRAADWLAARALPAESVVDTRGWTALYSGLTTYRFDAGRLALDDPNWAYLVCEQRELEGPTARAATLRRLRAHWPGGVLRFALADRPSAPPVLVFCRRKVPSSAAAGPRHFQADHQDGVPQASLVSHPCSPRAR